MTTKPVELVVPPTEPTTERPRIEEKLPAVGEWYWLKNDKPEDGEPDRWLTCATHVGSNYVKVTAVGESSERIHFDDFDEKCTFEPNPQPYIDAKIKHHWDNAQQLMCEVQAITAQLGVAPRAQLDGPSGETQALALRRDEPVDAYKKALIKAQKKTLPDLFKKIEEENKLAAKWMKAALIPVEAQAQGLRASIDRIEDRIFSVELYAGLIEQVVKIKKGKPAPNDTPIHVMQRRHYMDEECLVGYEHGGMEYKNVEDFDRWLCKPQNRDRILPFPRTVVAFRIRRSRKERYADTLAGYIEIMMEEQADKKTFLYMRNGDQVFRLITGIEFEKKLFPDQDQRVLGQGKLWARVFAGHVDPDREILTDDQYKAQLEEAEQKAKTKDDFGHFDEWKLRELRDDWKPFDKASVYYDDIAKAIEARANRHNRLVLVLQGLLDRSPVFHPHPPWQLWTDAGFVNGVKLIFDDTRALVAGEKPDFEAYRAELNAYLQTGSLTVGQETVWRRREQRKYEAKDRKGYWYPTRGNPGPGTLARVVRYIAKSRACRYEWKRERARVSYSDDPTPQVTERLTTGEEHVLNVDAYKPGDFHKFFDDPRTRQEYLKWAPLLLEAEEAHAGNRELKPMSLHGPPLRKPKYLHEKRDEDLRPEKPRKPRPPVGAEYRNMIVQLRWDTETTAGTKFKAGEHMRVWGYDRRKLTLEAVKGKDRRIRGVSISSVIIVGPAKK